MCSRRSDHTSVANATNVGIWSLDQSRAIAVTDVHGQVAVAWKLQQLAGLCELHGPTRAAEAMRASTLFTRLS